MKVINFIMPLVLLVSATWVTDFEQAKIQAKKNNQLILLSFSGSDWCAPCIRMKKEIFDAPQFQEFAATNLVLVKADFPRHKKNQLEVKQIEHNEKLAEQFNPNGKFPLTILLDSDGKVIRQWDGYSDMSVEEFINELQASTREK
jgi:thioredoxin-related protein